MKTIQTIFIAGLTALTLTTPAADPYADSWLTTYSGRYTRVYTNDTMKASGTTITTWGNGSQNQTAATYCGVQEIYSSANWVYVRTTGLGQHTMGPWYNTAARTVLFVNLPVNQKALVRFPRTPTVPVTKTTVQGEGGYFVDGVIMFDARDAVSYINSTGQDGNPPGVGTQGDGIWNRDAYVNEGITFDPALAHQQNTGVYHYHANPIATRYLLGDHIDFNPTTKIYSESTNAVTKHSPIVGWAKDGFPIYGPYGYSSASNSASGLRRMVGGFVTRNGLNGTTNLVNRRTLPAWAARAGNRSATLAANEYGPDVSASFPLGRYVEDNDYLGDLGQVQGVGFDLDEYNGRWCVTPEFPGTTYAYFVAISSNGTPMYPYNVGRQYYGNPTGGTTTLAETVATNFVGGPNLRETMNTPTRTGNTVVLTWSAVEGGTYRIESSTNLTTWTTNATGIAAVLNTGSNTNTSTESAKFFRVNRTAIANYDGAPTGGGSGGTFPVPGGSVSRGSGTNITLSITLSGPPSPPANAPITSVTMGSLTATSVSYTVQGTVLATFSILGTTPPGAQTVTVTFAQNPPPPYVFSPPNGFTINL